MKELRYILVMLAIVAGVILVAAVADLIRPYQPIEVVIEPDMIILPEIPSEP